MSSFATPPSPSSSASSGGPHTPETAAYTTHLALPVLPDLDGHFSNLDGYDDSSAGGVKRTLKMKQRANTAERRASHNAVERQRREALNARFLDLAAILPNLANVRRPSKSSIVNSSIAHVHASRRHRILAAQQLRMLASECDSLRREANEWRARAGVMRLDTPSRGGDVLDGLYEEEEVDDYAVAAVPGYRMEDEMMRMQLMQAQQQHAQSPFAHNVPAMMMPSHGAPPRGLADHPYAYALPVARPQSHGHSPIIASPTSYDNYDQQLQFQQLMMQQEADEKWAFTQQMMQAQGALEPQPILAQDRSRQGSAVW
ncbi:Macrophage erythroblast attacher isoform 1 [Mycena sanguinolenta]|uniref:Macrophage erythroblast attacher isoform 1 n=1 Tax=Mycena sanguinolenta TaxID=230812 RepID=A0A8H6YLK3_9AGAR|nr:Macrophage erythroblast attacher isoform 1 [Mycena sanguinolenta]